MGFPLSVQMLRQRTRAEASGSITTSIGAKFLTSSVSANDPKIKPLLKRSNKFYCNFAKWIIVFKHH